MVNEILRTAMRDGTLERIFRKWRVWNEDQPALFADVLAGNPLPPVLGFDLPGGEATVSKWRTVQAERDCAPACHISCAFVCQSIRERNNFGPPRSGIQWQA
jgi:hypothetical protein